MKIRHEAAKQNAPAEFCCICCECHYTQPQSWYCQPSVTMATALTSSVPLRDLLQQLGV